MGSRKDIISVVQNNFLHLFSSPSQCSNPLTSSFLKHTKPKPGPLYLFSLKCSFPEIRMQSLPHFVQALHRDASPFLSVTISFSCFVFHFSTYYYQT